MPHDRSATYTLPTASQANDINSASNATNATKTSSPPLDRHGFTDNPISPPALPTFTPLQLTHTPPAPVQVPFPSSQPIHHTAMSLTQIGFFHGDGREDENPINFLRNFIRHMHEIAITDDKKIALNFEYYLSRELVADDWYASLLTGVKESWANLEPEFKARFPATPRAKRMEEEVQQELLALQLKEEKLGTKVEVGGVEVWTHIDWANKAKRLATEAGLANKDMLIWSTRDKLPADIKSGLNPKYATWTLFTNAVRDFDIAKIQDGVERRRKHKGELDLINNCIQHLEQLVKTLQTPPSPTAAIRTNMRSLQLNERIPQPQFKPISMNPLPAPTPPCTAAARTPLTQDQRRSLMTSINTLPHHLNMLEGLQAYNRQVQQWAADHPMGRITEDMPFPLRLGTAPVCSAECWN